MPESSDAPACMSSVSSDMSRNDAETSIFPFASHSACCSTADHASTELDRLRGMSRDGPRPSSGTKGTWTLLRHCLIALPLLLRFTMYEGLGLYVGSALAGASGLGRCPSMRLKRFRAECDAEVDCLRLLRTVAACSALGDSALGDRPAAASCFVGPFTVRTLMYCHVSSRGSGRRRGGDGTVLMAGRES